MRFAFQRLPVTLDEKRLERPVKYQEHLGPQNSKIMPYTDESIYSWDKYSLGFQKFEIVYADNL